MKRVLLFILVALFVSLQLNAETLEKESKVVFDLTDEGIVSIEIGFSSSPGGTDVIGETIDLDTEGTHAVSTGDLYVYWDILCGTSFDLRLKSSGPDGGPLGNAGNLLNWNVVSVADEGMQGITYIDGISSPANYDNGGIVFHHDGAKFRSEGEEQIKIITDDFSNLSLADFGTTKLQLEIETI